MKKSFTLSVFCLVLIFSGWAQPAHIKFPEKFDSEKYSEYFNENIHFGIENPFLFKKPASQIKGDDWWKPDTVYIFQPNPKSIFARRIYQYNQQGLLITETEQYQQEDAWITSGQCKYTYYANNNLQTKLHEGWGSWPWEIFSKYTYTYDSRNNLLLELVEDKRGDNTWVNNRQEIMTYDENDNLTTHLRQNWNQNTHTWGNSTLNTYTYDSNNNRLTRFIQTTYNNAWSNFAQYTYTYDSKNNRLTDLYQTWADNNSGWIDRVFYTYTYYSNNNRQTELCERYTNSSKEESTYTYDTENNLINQSTKTWQNGSWINSSRINYTYDSRNNLLSYLREKWNNTWINNLQMLWTYDENDNCTLVENFSFSDGKWYPVNIPMYLYYNNMQSSLYYDAYKVTATYKEVTKPITAIEDFLFSTISIYPNPTFGQLNIINEEQNIKRITIFDLYGVRLFNTNHTTFDISHFSAGVYVVQIITEKGIVTKKIVKM